MLQYLKVKVVRCATSDTIYFCFSENLTKDSYLRSKMDSEQWVPIVTVAGFPLIQKMTLDISFVVAALKGNNQIKVFLKSKCSSTASMRIKCKCLSVLNDAGLVTSLSMILLHVSKLVDDSLLGMEVVSRLNKY